ncbi:oligoendopeptidase F [Aneurinibacillus terranovensis]|uniref:oligoendopeptidase F n=1 Tax=Aneurinibacillus terranovensis TaxID=278991 RepID=UPI000686B627|nr:oligoendopeptidase F [Aneurinibacillus terranovensis]
MKRSVYVAAAAAASLAVLAVRPGTLNALGAVHAQAAFTADHTAVKPEYKTRGEIPAEYKWKLEDIYPNKSAWERDAKKVEELANAFPLHEGKLASSVGALSGALDDYSELCRLRDKVILYTNLGLDVNTSSTQAQELYDRAMKINTLVGEKTAWFSPELVAVPEDKMKNYLASKRVAHYKKFLQDILREKPHTLSKSMEKLLAGSSPLAQTPSGVFTMLSKDVNFPKIKDENGKDIQLTRANFISYMESKNENVRKSAFKAYYQTLGNFQDTFAQILAASVKADNFYAQAHHYNTALEASLYPNEIPTNVYSELIKTVDANLPLLHRYIAWKKKILGLRDMHMYDMYTPVVPYNDKYIPYEQAKEMVLAGLKPMGEGYEKVLKQAFSRGWIDVYSTRDKQSGAYQSGAYATHPYVLLNYQGTYDDVFTIAHELGHAMQSYYSNKKQPYSTAGYPIFTAEIASTLNEQLLFKSQYARAKTKEEKIYLLNRYLENFRTTLFRQTQFAEFEKLIHEKEQAGESLNAEALKKIYAGLNAKYYGKAVVNDPEIGMEWARIPHFYNSFYVYQYATSFAASAALAKQIEKSGKQAVDRIRNKFLEAGSSAAPLEIVKAAGIDMSSPQPIQDAMKQFELALNELEKVAGEKCFLTLLKKTPFK